MTDWSDHRDFIITLVITAISTAATDVRLGWLVVGRRGNRHYWGHCARCVCGIFPIFHRCRTGHRWWLLGLTRLVWVGQASSVI